MYILYNICACARVIRTCLMRVIYAATVTCAFPADRLWLDRAPKNMYGVRTMDVSDVMTAFRFWLNGATKDARGDDDDEYKKRDGRADVCRAAAARAEREGRAASHARRDSCAYDIRYYPTPPLYVYRAFVLNGHAQLYIYILCARTTKLGICFCRVGFL